MSLGFGGILGISTEFHSTPASPNASRILCAKGDGQ
jgi:hypothetical protein